MNVTTRHGATVLTLAADGPAIDSAGQANDLIGDAWSATADTVVVPASRLGTAFFDLSTRVAGEITQKLVNYRIRFVVLGDVTAERARSDAFDAYVWESNRGTQIWFLPDTAALDARLAAAAR
ncbi:DUF4180 domain-containing protein [Agromyces archimandritae]|uniref:DUF4180 domain-containing protein n=1 Tax=Agromyces archimandritae TaxID=2781962 RepID=A0A975FQ54_9MICO|nr:DUF4180 domain-containing protein [Agromyces archimandritae]QTX05954.1 DUF4180 domain-containing protein [Agromyces archimandritae]